MDARWLKWPKSAGSATPKNSSRNSDGNGHDKQLTIIRALQKAIGSAAAQAAGSRHNLTNIYELVTKTAAAMDETSRATASISDQSNQIAHACESCSQQAGELVEISNQSQQSLEQVSVASQESFEALQAGLQKFTELASHLQNIGKVTGIIKDIAFETKLLSFNASVEAARAGFHGQGFSVVSKEIGNLATKAADQNIQIAKLVSLIETDLAPAMRMIQKSLELSEKTKSQAELAMKNINSAVAITQETAQQLNHINTSVTHQKSALEEMAIGIQQAAESAVSIENGTKELNQRMDNLGESITGAYTHLDKVDTGSLFHQALHESRSVARQIETLFTAGLKQQDFALKDLLDPQYQEIRGLRKRALQHLFDVSQVTSDSFNPSKYSTGYDLKVDENLRVTLDAARTKIPGLSFFIYLDLNAYAPIHNSDFCADLTGDPAVDLAKNRAKRFFDDSPALLKGARMGLGPSAEKVSKRVSRSEFERAGCQLTRMGDVEGLYLVQTYPRDTGEAMTILTTPVFVGSDRVGTILSGWKEA